MERHEVDMLTLLIFLVWILYLRYQEDIQGWLWYIFWFLATGNPITMMYHRIKDKLRNT